MKSEKKGILFVLLAGVAWSFGGVLSKFAVWNAFTLAGFRSVVAVILLGISRRSFRFVNNRVTWLGALGVVATSVLFILGNKLTSAANTIVLQYAMPAIVVLYEILFRREVPPKRELIAIGVVFLGVILCFCQGFSSGGMLGNVLALLSAVTWAVVFLTARLPGCDAQAYAYQGNLLGCLFMLAMPFDKSVNGDPAQLLVPFFMGLALGAGYLFFSLGMKQAISPVTAAVVANVEPVLNPFWCFLFLRENPGPLSLCGMILVLGAVTVYSILTGRKTGNAETPGNG